MREPTATVVDPRRVRPPLGVARQVPREGVGLGGGGRFLSPCPACDRRLRIRLAFAGQALQCKHCGHCFVPSGPDAVLGDLFAQLAAALIAAERRGLAADSHGADASRRQAISL